MPEDEGLVNKKSGPLFSGGAKETGESWTARAGGDAVTARPTGRRTLRSPASVLATGTGKDV